MPIDLVLQQGGESKQWENYNLKIEPRFGQSLGMIIRCNLSSTFSTETGLNLVNRRYQLSIDNRDIALQDISNFNLRSYELPLQILSNEAIPFDPSMSSPIKIFLLILFFLSSDLLGL